MTFVLIFVISSVIASLFTLAVCMLFSSRSPQHSLARVYVE